MAELLCSKYIPAQTMIVKRDGKTKGDYVKLGYGVENLPGGFYYVIKPPVLEMVFREREQDYVFDMMDELCKHYGITRGEATRAILARMFALKIVTGKIKVTIFQDGTYALE